MKVSQRAIADALQQMNGFKIGKWDDIISLIIAIGLTKEEWEYIKEKQDCGLDGEDIEDIDEYFAEQSTSPSKTKSKEKKQ